MYLCIITHTIHANTHPPMQTHTSPPCKHTQCNPLSSPLPIQTVMLSAVEKLIRHVDTRQLTSDLGGFLPYDHEEWIKLRLVCHTLHPPSSFPFSHTPPPPPPPPTLPTGPRTFHLLIQCPHGAHSSRGTTTGRRPRPQQRRDLRGGTGSPRSDAGPAEEGASEYHSRRKRSPPTSRTGTTSPQGSYHVQNNIPTPLFSYYI